MKVETILKAKGGHVVTVQPNATVGTAIRRLKLERIGALVVSQNGVELQGMISERDIVLGLAEHGGGLLQLQVAELMTREVRTCTPQDSIKHVMGEMTRSRVRHLPVIEHGKLVGIVSLGDVVKNRLEEVELEASVLRDAYIAAR
ncbi:MAG TPA: CBS domain-containing protein [Dongiaceae bacterium]|nr:CBS domain-containing protein [Dongiaceae bacterium]